MMVNEKHAFPLDEIKQYSLNAPWNRPRLIRLPEVMSRVGLSRATVYKRINERAFPEPVPLGARSVAWLESDIDDWISDRVQSAKAKEVQS